MCTRVIKPCRTGSSVINASRTQYLKLMSVIPGPDLQGHCSIPVIASGIISWPAINKFLRIVVEYGCLNILCTRPNNIIYTLLYIGKGWHCCIPHTLCTTRIVVQHIIIPTYLYNNNSSDSSFGSSSFWAWNISSSLSRLMGSVKVFESSATAAVIHPDFSSVKPLNYSVSALFAPLLQLSSTKFRNNFFILIVPPVMDGSVYF